jgi:Anti-sigma-K factor rskA, C-terminal/Putative zinc-finger
MTELKHIAQEDLALYAMQALAPEESEAIRAHLQACHACRAELSMLSGDLGLLAMSVDQKPLPAGARDRFLARIAADAPAQLAAPPQPRRNQTWRWVLPMAWGAVAALVVLAAALQLQVRSLDRKVREEAALLQQQESASARAQRVLDLLTAPAAQHIELTAAAAKPAPAARTVYLASQGALLMQASHLDPVPAGKTYELWVIPTHGAPVPAGLFRPDAAGNASVVLPSLPRGVEAKAFGVTVEDAGGSATPTLPIVLQGAPPKPAS